jgi:hypothetical protein
MKHSTRFDGEQKGAGAMALPDFVDCCARAFV